MMHRYKREDMLANLLDATRTHTGVRRVVMWVCDCGCDVAQWYQRTDQGMAFTQQAWPPGESPKVIVLESREDVEALVGGTVAMMRSRGTGGVNSDVVEGRIKSFEKAVWSAWADS